MCIHSRNWPVTRTRNHEIGSLFVRKCCHRIYQHVWRKTFFSLENLFRYLNQSGIEARKDTRVMPTISRRTVVYIYSSALVDSDIIFQRISCGKRRTSSRWICIIYHKRRYSIWCTSKPLLIRSEHTCRKYVQYFLKIDDMETRFILREYVLCFAPKV